MIYLLTGDLYTILRLAQRCPWLSKKDFEKSLLEAVDEALSSLGEFLKQETYRHLEESFNIPKREIPYKIEAFTSGIEEILGSEAEYLEVMVLQKLYEKVGESFERNKSKSLRLQRT